MALLSRDLPLYVGFGCITWRTVQTNASFCVALIVANLCARNRASTKRATKNHGIKHGRTHTERTVRPSSSGTGVFRNATFLCNAQTAQHQKHALLKSSLHVQKHTLWIKQKIEDAYHTHTFLGVPRNSSCLLYTSPSPRDRTRSRMPSSA